MPRLGTLDGFDPFKYTAFDFKTAPVFRSFRSFHTIAHQMPKRAREAHAPGVVEAIERRIDSTGGVAYPLAGCQCMRWVVNGRVDRRSMQVLVNRVRYNVVRELYRVTFDCPVAEMPKTLYRHCQTPNCVQPHHWRSYCPRDGRRGHEREMTHSDALSVWSWRCVGMKWRELEAKFGWTPKTMRAAIKHYGID